MSTSRFIALALAALALGVGAGNLLPEPDGAQQANVGKEESNLLVPGVPDLIAKGHYRKALAANPSNRSIFATFRSWYLADPEVAQSAIAGLPKEQQAPAIAGVLTSAAENHPEALTLLIETLPVTNLMVQSAFGILAKANLPKAVKIAQTLSSHNPQMAARSGLVPVIATLPLERALELVSSVDDEEYRKLLISATATDYAERGEIDVLDSPFEEALRPHAREMLGQALVRAMAKTDPILAAQWINEEKIDTLNPADFVEYHLMPALIHKPAALVMEVLGNVEDRGKALLSLFAASTEISEDRVMEFMELEKDPEVRRTLAGWYGSINPDIGDFSDLVDRVAENPDHRRALLSEAAAQAMDERRLDHAWLICSLDDNMHDSRRELLREYARQDPVAATALLSEFQGTYQKAAIEEITSQWVMTDPRATAHWLMNSADTTDIPTAAYSSVASAWTRADSLGASEWIASLPSGEPRDAAIHGMVPNILEYDREAALAWTAQIGIPAIKAELTELIENSKEEK